LCGIGFSQLALRLKAAIIKKIIANNQHVIPVSEKVFSMDVCYHSGTLKANAFLAAVFERNRQWAFISKQTCESVIFFRVLKMTCPPNQI
jgi:hypothetical protein